ncbi:SMP-30/gluconolactonase/LRE family protein [Bordetella petrii]|uniref:SMP-30/gluconolactonase/LRE family protein n=1 Tax=Bordetella petrii TaxID=94624 RepID=UPI001A95C76D|nr:SMP-30/gluconolactonase/LRE family protein [Bordetella petrii]MBO1112837.1 SMP-30/gluconolactonase/LRE family protein [Bordetella petrii]
MFAPPEILQAEVFARIPERHLVRGRSSDWARTQLHGAPAPVFLEGPSFDRAGNLWVVDIPWGRIFRIDPKGGVELAAEYDGEPNGLKFHSDGRAFIADYKNGIMVLEPQTGRVEPYLDRARLERFKGCNDLFFAANGDLYFTDQGQSGLHDPSGRLYRLRPSGQLDVVLQGIPSPNGLVMNLDETAVYLAVTRDNAIWRVPLMADGSATKVGVYIQMSGGGGPDGIALDAEGGLAVCHVGFGAVWIFSPRGEPQYRIDAPEGLYTTNCAYGGPDGRTLYMIESRTGCVFTARLPVMGKTMYSHTPA